jgi:hypothetical protein
MCTRSAGTWTGCRFIRPTEYRVLGVYKCPHSQRKLAIRCSAWRTSRFIPWIHVKKLPLGRRLCGLHVGRDTVWMLNPAYDSTFRVLHDARRCRYSRDCFCSQFDTLAPPHVRVVQACSSQLYISTLNLFEKFALVVWSRERHVLAALLTFHGGGEGW